MQRARYIAALATLVVVGTPASSRAQDGPALPSPALPSPAVNDGYLPDCPAIDKLGRLERQALKRVLVKRDLAIDEAPEGKRIGQVHVEALDVFGPGDRFLRWFNIFHRTTRHDVIRRELVIEPGELWDPERIDESMRKLRDVLFHSIVVIVPVRSASSPDEVDLLMITRDVWSLRLNSAWEYQESELSFLTLSISENNFLGRRMQAAVVFDMDQGIYSVGPLYVNKNLGGAHLDLRGRLRTIFNRETNDFEGTSSVLSFGRPLWSLESKWGWQLDWSQRFAIDRVYRGVGLLTYDAPETPEDDMLPYEYRQRRFEIQVAGVRAIGDDPDGLKHHLSLGHELVSTRTGVLDGFPDNDVLREAFERDVLPRSERTSLIFTGYKLFMPRYRTFQNINTFDLAEETRFGPLLELSAGVALGVIGSEADFTRYSLSAGWTFGLGETGIFSAGASAVLRLQGDDFIDNAVAAEVRFVSPRFARSRVVARAEVGGLINETQNRFYRVGGDTGLRAYGIAEFYGETKVVGGVEVRSDPLALGFTRWGLVGFYEVGGAADTWDELGLHQDAGVGLRMLLPHLNPELFRIDWAFAFDGVGSGWPGRFSAGIRQSF